MFNFTRKFKTKREQDYYNLAERRGFKWLGEAVPPDTSHKTLWQCAFNHEWYAAYNKIQVGRGCPYCSGKARKTGQDYHDLALDRGFQWLGSEVPINIRTKTLWRCSKDHEWLAKYGDVNAGSGCPECRKVSVDQYYALAAKRGFEWLGPFPKSVHEKTLWRCAKSHEWQAAYRHVVEGSGCPYCVNQINGVPASKMQIQLCELLNTFETDLEWQLNFLVDRRRIDLANIKYRLGIELDVWYWHKDKLDQDQFRLQELLDQGWRILSIKTARILPNIEDISTALGELWLGLKYIEIVTEDWGKND